MNVTIVFALDTGIGESRVDLGYLPGAHRRINSCDEILGLLGNAVDHVYYKHVVAGGNESQVGSFCVIFSIKRE